MEHLAPSEGRAGTPARQIVEDMKNSTIATSRTRATSDPLLIYRPLREEWGDADALRTLRTQRSRTARPSVSARRTSPAAEIASAPSAPARRPARTGRHRFRTRAHAPAHRFGLLGLLHGA